MNHASAETNVWERGYWVWQVVALSTFAISVLVSWATLDPAARVRVIGLFLVASVAIVGLARRGLMWNAVPLLVAFVAWFGLVRVAPGFWPSIGVLFALCYVSLELAPALALAAALAAVEATQIFLNGGAAAAIVIAGITYSGSALFAIWIDRVIAQSKTRADIIEQLELTRAELTVTERRAGALEERARLTGEIHDTLAQGFSSIVMLVQAASARLPSDPTAAAGLLDKVERSAREHLAEARSLVACDLPPALDGATLAGAVHRLAERVGAELDIPVESRVDGEQRLLERPAEVALLRAAQEGLANVAKHAHASKVLLTLTYSEESAAVVVTEDGCGFDARSTLMGFGLPGMRARVAALGGRLEVRSVPGGGTTIAAEVPA